MIGRNFTAVGIVVVSLCVLAGIAFALTAPGRVFPSSKDMNHGGTSHPVRPTWDKNHRRESRNAYKSGIPGNGEPFPDGSVIAKIERSKKKNPVSLYPVVAPDTLKSVSFIEKDSKRFPDTNGLGYTQFLHDAASGTFKPYRSHTPVKTKDFIFHELRAKVKS